LTRDTQRKKKKKEWRRNISFSKAKRQAMYRNGGLALACVVPFWTVVLSDSDLICLSTWDSILVIKAANFIHIVSNE
jgi:hypothetical protein